MNTKDATTEKLWSGKLTFILVIGMLYTFTFQLMAPILTMYAVSLNASLALAGVLTGILAFTALAMRPVTGIITDTYNKKTLLFVSALLTSFAVLFYSFAKNIEALFVFRIIHALGFVIFTTVNLTLSSFYIPASRLGEGLGYVGLSQTIIATIAPGVGLSISQRYGYNAVFYTAFVCATIVTIFVLFIQPANKITQKLPFEKHKIRFQDFISIKLFPYAGLAGAFSLSSAIIMYFIAFIAKEKAIQNISLFFTVNAAALLVIRPIIGKLQDKRGAFAMLLPASLFTAAAMIMIAKASSTYHIIFSAVFNAIGQGIAMPALQAECFRKLPEQRGVATSTLYIGSDIAQIIAPILGGTISSIFGYEVTFFSTGVVMIITFAVLIIYVITAKMSKKATN